MLTYKTVEKKYATQSSSSPIHSPGCVSNHKQLTIQKNGTRYYSGSDTGLSNMLMLQLLSPHRTTACKTINQSERVAFNNNKTTLLSLNIISYICHTFNDLKLHFGRLQNMSQFHLGQKNNIKKEMTRTWMLGDFILTITTVTEWKSLPSNNRIIIIIIIKQFISHSNMAST